MMKEKFVWRIIAPIQWNDSKALVECLATDSFIIDFVSKQTETIWLTHWHSMSVYHFRREEKKSVRQ